MVIGYDYTHSNIGADGKDYITFMIEPERLDSHGMRCARAVDITNDYKKNIARISTFQWIYGYVKNFEVIKILKEQTVSDIEVPVIMKKLGITIK